jgi:putative resolvase
VDILRGRVPRFVLVAKDPLLLFGSDLLFRICELFHVEVVNHDAPSAVSLDRQLTKNLAEILAISC